MPEEHSIEIRERMAGMERDLVTHGRELGEIKKKQDAQGAILQQMQAMNASIAVLAEQVKQLAITTAKLEERMGEVEKRPAKRWDAVIGAVIAGVVGIIVGLVFK